MVYTNTIVTCLSQTMLFLLQRQEKQLDSSEMRFDCLVIFWSVPYIIMIAHELNKIVATFFINDDLRCDKLSFAIRHIIIHNLT